MEAVSFQERKKELEKAFMNVQLKRNEIMDLMDTFRNKPTQAGLEFPLSRVPMYIIFRS